MGNYDWLKNDGLLDVIEAVTPWMWHQPASEGASYPALLQKLRTQIPATMPVCACKTARTSPCTHVSCIQSWIPPISANRKNSADPGVYIKNSAMGWLSPASVNSTINNAIEIYDSAKQNTPATIIFAGVWL